MGGVPNIDRFDMPSVPGVPGVLDVPGVPGVPGVVPRDGPRDGVGDIPPKLLFMLVVLPLEPMDVAIVEAREGGDSILCCA